MIPNNGLKRVCFYICLLFLLDGSEYGALLTIPLSNSKNAITMEDVNYSYLKEYVFTEEAPAVCAYPVSYEDNPDVYGGDGIFMEDLSAELQKRVYFVEKWDDKCGYIRYIIVRKPL